MRMRKMATLASFIIMMGLFGSASIAEAVDPDPVQTGGGPEATMAIFNTNAAGTSPLGGAQKGASSTHVWTKERMRAATPMGVPFKDDTTVSALPSPGRKVSAPASTTTPGQNMMGETISQKGEQRLGADQTYHPTTTGQLFFVDVDGYERYCGASTVLSKGRNLIVTSAHCVRGHSFWSSEEEWFKDFIYVPGDNDVDMPYGIWRWKEVRILTEWTQNKSDGVDQAFISLWPEDGKNVVDVAGGNPITFNSMGVESNIKVWGWPAGESQNYSSAPYLCTTWSERIFTSWAMAACEFEIKGHEPGGGPWLRETTAPDRGTIFGVTRSNRVRTDGHSWTYASIFSRKTAVLYSKMK